MKHLKVRQKYSAARRIFQLRDLVMKRHMFDILLQGIQYNRLQVQINQPV